MLLKSHVIGLLITSVIIFSDGIALAEVQTFDSDIGTVEINIPYSVEPGKYSSGTSLQLVKIGTTKPIISINIFDAATFEDFQNFAEFFIGQGHQFDKMTSLDGKPMLFNALQDGTDQDGNPLYTFRGYIDYSNEIGRYIIIHAPNKVTYKGAVIAIYTREEFASICQTFTIK